MGLKRGTSLVNTNKVGVMGGRYSNEHKKGGPTNGYVL